MRNQNDHGAIAFAEKMLELLDEGRFTSTYKYAVVLALIDLCMERTQASGAPPETVTTRQMAEKIVEIYWPHTVPFHAASATILKQNKGGQAEIISAILRFRRTYASDATAPRWEAKLRAPEPYEQLVRTVETKLIEMPLRLLQYVANRHTPFIYEVNWEARFSQRSVTRYQRGERGVFDNRLLLHHKVGEYLLMLNSLLRAFIQRRWAAMVAQVNRLEDSQLEEFLFGMQRTPTAKVRTGLWEIQEKRCFYCAGRIHEPANGEVDHFLPWARYPDDGIDNLVVADKRCNADKSSSLAATEHLVRWAGRFTPNAGSQVALENLAAEVVWDRAPGRSLNVARAIYGRLPPDARLWLRSREFVPPDVSAIQSVLSS